MNWLIILSRKYLPNKFDGFIHLTPTNKTIFLIFITHHDLQIRNSELRNEIINKDDHNYLNYS